MNRNTILGLSLSGLVFGMVGMAFAAVPLYQLFCQVTGYAGTPARADENWTRGPTSTQTVTVRFDANTNAKLPWKFRALQDKVTVPLGKDTLIRYVAKNLSDKPVIGTATFNVTPFKVAQYFTKIECFCFTEQILGPGETMEMPVSFYVDPEMLEDENARDVSTITLSYTFFRDDKAMQKLAAKSATVPES